MTGDTALRFGHWFGTGPQLWLNLQSAYEIPIAEERWDGKSQGCRCAHERLENKGSPPGPSGFNEAEAHLPALQLGLIAREESRGCEKVARAYVGILW